MKKIALLGHGVVGSGVMEILTKNQKLLARQAGEPVEAAWVLDRRAFPGLPYSQRFTQDFSLIREDPEVAVVLEALGGVGPAFTWGHHRPGLHHPGAESGQERGHLQQGAGGDPRL